MSRTEDTGIDRDVARIIRQELAKPYIASKGLTARQVLLQFKEPIRAARAASPSKPWRQIATDLARIGQFQPDTLQKAWATIIKQEAAAKRAPASGEPAQAFAPPVPANRNPASAAPHKKPAAAELPPLLSVALRDERPNTFRG